MGETFSIQEENLKSFIQKRVSEVQNKGQIQRLLLEKAQNPLSVEGLQEAEKYHSFQLDLSYRAKNDILDARGNLLVPKGTMINPLEKIKLKEGLLFLDGSQPQHIAWARRQKGRFKWILVKGKLLEIEQQEKRPIYFDQGGVYCSMFRIRNIPSRVTQKEGLLFIEEMPIKPEDLE